MTFLLPSSYLLSCGRKAEIVNATLRAGKGNEKGPICGKNLDCQARLNTLKSQYKWNLVVFERNKGKSQVECSLTLEMENNLLHCPMVNIIKSWVKYLGTNCSWERQFIVCFFCFVYYSAVLCDCRSIQSGLKIKESPTPPPPPTPPFSPFKTFSAGLSTDPHSCFVYIF